MSYQIYEFSRAFDRIRNFNGKWVSGGYSPDKIAHWNESVPEPIRTAVVNELFALNDNYPPEPGEVSLIAREIAEYAVLAIANRQLDDGGRPTIGYRYFWLHVSNEDDGIGTLLNWWVNAPLTFAMEEAASSNIPPIHPVATNLIAQKISLDRFESLQPIVAKITTIPAIETTTHHPWMNHPEFHRLHWQTTALAKRLNQPIAWAWNVRRLLHPTHFLSISCATDFDRAALNLKPKSLQSALNHPSTTQTLSPTLAPTPPKISPIDPRTAESIKHCMTTIARKYSLQRQLDREEIQKLFTVLQQYPNADWTQFIDQQTLKLSNLQGSLYRALVYLLLPTYQPNWIVELIRSLDRGSILNSIFAGDIGDENDILHFQGSLMIQAQRLSPQASPDAPLSIKQKFEQAFILGIDSILKLWITHPPDKLLTNYLKTLFTQTRNIWASQFRAYTRRLWSDLSMPDRALPSQTSYFRQQIAHCIDLQNQQRVYYPALLKVAKLCEDTNELYCAALLYRLSTLQPLPKRYPYYLRREVDILFGQRRNAAQNYPPVPIHSIHQNAIGNAIHNTNRNAAANHPTHPSQSFTSYIPSEYYDHLSQTSSRKSKTLAYVKIALSTLLLLFSMLLLRSGVYQPIALATHFFLTAFITIWLALGFDDYPPYIVELIAAVILTIASILIVVIFVLFPELITVPNFPFKLR